MRYPYMRSAARKYIAAVIGRRTSIGGYLSSPCCLASGIDYMAVRSIKFKTRELRRVYPNALFLPLDSIRILYAAPRCPDNREIERPFSTDRNLGIRH